LDGEGAEIVVLRALGDLERIVAAVGEGGVWGPDELASSCRGGKGGDGLKVGGRALTQDDRDRIDGVIGGKSDRLRLPVGHRVWDMSESKDGRLRGGDGGESAEDKRLREHICGVGGEVRGSEEEEEVAQERRKWSRVFLKEGYANNERVEEAR